MKSPHDPFWKAKHLWYMTCVEKSCEYPMGSFLYTFWWSLRYELGDAEGITKWAKKPTQAVEDWYEYFLFKWKQLEGHRTQHGKVIGNED